MSARLSGSSYLIPIILRSLAASKCRIIRVHVGDAGPRVQIDAVQLLSGK